MDRGNDIRISSLGDGTHHDVNIYDTIRYMAGPFVMRTVRGRLAAAVAYLVS